MTVVQLNPPVSTIIVNTRLEPEFVGTAMSIRGWVHTSQTDASVGSGGLISIPDREVANKQSGTFATAVNRHPNLLGPI